MRLWLFDNLSLFPPEVSGDPQHKVMLAFDIILSWSPHAMTTFFQLQILINFYNKIVRLIQNENDSFWSMANL